MSRVYIKRIAVELSRKALMIEISSPTWGFSLLTQTHTCMHAHQKVWIALEILPRARQQIKWIQSTKSRIKLLELGMNAWKRSASFACALFQTDTSFLSGLVQVLLLRSLKLIQNIEFGNSMIYNHQRGIKFNYVHLPLAVDSIKCVL